MSGLQEAFRHGTDDFGYNPAEIFESNNDYPPKGKQRGLIGSFALLVVSDEKADELQGRFDAWREKRRAKTSARIGKAMSKLRTQNEKRKTEKAERKYSGSLSEISGAIIPFEEAYVKIGAETPVTIPDPDYMQPHKMGSPGMYRSIHAIHNPADPGEGGRPNEGVHAIDDEMAQIMQGAVKHAKARIADDGETATTQMPIIQPRREQHIQTPADDDQLVGAGK